MTKGLNSNLLVSLFFVLFLGNLNKAQAQCIETLRLARTVYDEGRLHELPIILENCLKEGFNEEEKTEAYRLLILSYIYQDQPAMADDAMLSLLRSNPRFKIDPDTDPNELINLHKTFRTDPIYRVGGKIAVSYSLINITKFYGVNSFGDSNGSYTGNIGFGGSAFIEKDFFNNLITFRAEPSFAINKFTYSGTAFPNDDDPTEFSATWEGDVETQSWIGLNLSARYPFLEKSKLGKKLHPNIILGPSAQYLISSNSANTTNIDGGESASGADIDFLDSANDNRKKINLSAIAGIGIIIPVGKMSFVTDITYQYGLVNITKKHYSEELSLKYGRAMSDQTLNAFNISAGLMINKYSPKKLDNN